MLSRVAAVTAPRTHNRRRGTGSSGRRREGRESERQRPNMSRRVFTSAALLLLVVVMMCCNTGGAEVQQPADPQFAWKGIKDGETVTVESLGVPGLLKVGSHVFAVAEAQCKKSGESATFTGIASQLITTSTAKSPEELLKNPKDKTQVLEQDGSEGPKNKIDVSRPATVVNGNDIYMLVGKYSPTAVGSDPKSGAGDLGFLLVKGNVIDESDSGKGIQWKNNTDVSRVSFDEQPETWTRLIGGGGSGVHTKDGRLLFPVEGTKKGELQKDEKAVLLLIYTLKDKKSWKLSNWMSADGCSDPSVVEWEKDNQLIMMTACDDGRRRVYESSDKGESWTEALGTLSRVWGNKQGGEAKAVRSGFTTDTIGNGVEDSKRNVMLVTLPVYKRDKNKNEKGVLHLWLTDNTHIVDIGPVSGNDDVAASSLLYNSETKELIALYEKKKGNGGTSPDMVSVRLTDELQRVKDVLATWKKVDGIVSKLCPSNAEKGAPPGNVC
ncbi:trans-sialidase, putative, partial [Trypanosoma cruzi marinkellei]